MKLRIEHNHEVANTFGFDVRAARWIEYDCVEQLREVVALLAADGCTKVLHVGAGSNLLFTGDFDGTVLHSGIKGVEMTDESGSDVFVRVGAAEVWDDFVALSLKRGWYGLENLSLIPGEVGASAVQNIGAYGVEAKDFIWRVETVDLQSGEECVFDVAECDYSYRKSIFKTSLRGRYAVTHVVFKLSRDFQPHLGYGNLQSSLPQGVTVTAEMVRQAVIDMRRSKLPDPEVLGSAGSFFMNPVVEGDVFNSLIKVYIDMPHYSAGAGMVKIPAGWLIEKSGWKGRKMGRAAVHDKQALVLVNLGGASGEDVVRLAEAVAKDVREKFGIDIHPEVNII